MTELPEAIRRAINTTSAEDGSNTPDYILARLLLDTLDAHDRATRDRDAHYGVKMQPGIKLVTQVQLDAAHALVVDGEAELERTRADLERTRELLHGATRAFDDLQAFSGQYKAERDQARREVNQMEADIRYLTTTGADIWYRKGWRDAAENKPGSGGQAYPQTELGKFAESAQRVHETLMAATGQPEAAGTDEPSPDGFQQPQPLGSIHTPAGVVNLNTGDSITLPAGTTSTVTLTDGRTLKITTGAASPEVTN